jgi:hypothetical protein
VLDTLAFASGCLVVPYALPEFRFVELMQRVYGVAPSPRFRMLLDESRRASALRGREEQRKRAAEQARMEREPSPELASLPAGEELSASDALLPAPMAAAEAEPTERPLLEVDPEPLLLDRRAPSPTLEALERALAGSDARGKLIDTALALACRFAHLAALFVVRDDYASGLAARRGDEALGIDRIVLPLAAQDGLLARCLSTREAQRGLPSSGLDRALAKSLRSTPDTELAVFAVAIGGRVVNLLVAQAASGALGGTAAAALGALAPQIGAAYERLIRAQKQKARAGVASPAKRPREKAAIGALPLQKRVVRVPAPKP